MNNKAIETKDSSNIYTDSIVLRIIHTLINSFNNDIGETIGKPNHYKIVTVDFNMQIQKRKNLKETVTGKCVLE